MKFIKGNAIAHATRYELHKKVDDSSYEKIGTQYIGNKQYNNRGYFNAIGTLTEGTASTSNYVYTDMIDVTRLVDYVVDENTPNYKVCARVLTGDEDQVAAVFYSSTDRASKVYCMTYNEVISAGGFNAATIQSIAQEHNAGYVSFSSYAGNVDYIDVCFNNDIFFCLDDYAEVLTSGDVLVVVAVGEGDTDTDGDGIIYTDSDYSNAVVYSMITPTLITFTIDGTSYQAEEGMTWKEWANSEYNTSRYFWGDYSNAILSQDGLTSNYVQADGVDVQGGTTIISGFAYTINSVFQGSND